jgi:zinc/manganese transport system substrate-binding protein
VLNAVDISGFTAREGGELNEHVWYDLPTMQKVATALADALGEADPEHAETFTRNASRFGADLQVLIDREAQLRKTLHGTKVGITEPVPGYMLEALGLVNLTPDAFSEAIEEGEDVSVSVLDETLSLYTDHEVDALVYNQQTTGAITEQVKQAAEDAGIPVVAITETPPEGESVRGCCTIPSYITWMKTNIDHLQEALSPS